ETSAAEAPRSGTTAEVQEADVLAEGASAGVITHGRGPAPDREAAHAEGRVRLRRRRSGRGGVARPGAAGVRRHRVPPGDPARRLPGEHLPRGTGWSRRAAVRDRPDGVHADDAGRGRDRRCDRGGRGRDPVRPVDHGHHLHRGRGRSRPRRAELVPALHVEGPRTVHGPGRPCCRRRVRHAAGHRGRPGGRCPAARRAQRDDDPPDPVCAHGGQRDLTTGMVDRLPDHGAARLRLARLVVRHGGRPVGHDVRPDGDVRRSRLDPGTVAGEDLGQGRPERRRRAAPRRPRRRRDRGLQPRRAPARPGTRAVPPPARRRPRSRLRCRGAPGHRDHVGPGHRGRDRPRRALHDDRARLPVRAHGRRPGRRRPHHRDPRRSSGAHHAAPRSELPRRAPARARHRAPTTGTAPGL
ncbi:MAG: L-lactate dehydrogenase, partial [uncultured Blastococcus sp.]